jgi:hypothetical protein
MIISDVVALTQVSTCVKTSDFVRLGKLLSCMASCTEAQTSARKELALYGEELLREAIHHLVYFFTKDRQRVVSLIIAAGVTSTAKVEHRPLGEFLCWRIPGFVISMSLSSAECGPRALGDYNLACGNDAVKSAAFDLARDRMTEVCIALQSLRLPALLTVLILRKSCAPPGSSLRFRHCWAVSTKVKHYLKR